MSSPIVLFNDLALPLSCSKRGNACRLTQPSEQRRIHCCSGGRILANPVVAEFAGVILDRQIPSRHRDACRELQLSNQRLTGIAMTTQCPSADQLLAAATDEARLADIAPHVGSCAACRRRLEQFTGDVTALRSVTRDWSPSPPTSPIENTVASTRPTTIGRYVVLSELGSGGQAVQGDCTLSHSPSKTFSR